MARLQRASTATEDIRRFATILEQALHDRSHEVSKEVRVVHFWDSDSLFLPIRGVLELDRDHSSYEDPQRRADRTAQSLFSAGFLGRVAMLNPHRDELLGQISYWMNEDRSDREIKSIRRHFLDQQPVKRVLSLAERLVEDLSDEGPGLVPPPILAELSELSADSFVCVEAAWGNWRRRLKRLMESALLDFDEYGIPIELSRRTKRFENFADQLGQLRKGGRAFPTAIDAAALTSLADLCDRARLSPSGDSPPIYPRFFTSSSNLRQLLDTRSWVRSLFTFSFTIAGVPHEDVIWRDGEYYLLRATHSGLRIGAEYDLDVHGSLIEMSERLTDALNAEDGSAMALVDSYQFEGDASIADVIVDIKELRMTQTWLRYGREAELPTHLHAIRTLAVSESAVEMLRDEEERKWDLLGKELEGRGLSMQIMNAVHNAALAFQRAASGSTLSLKWDLASLRWGMDYEGSDDRISLRLGPNRSIPRGVFSLYDLDRVDEDDADLRRTVAVLLGLDQFDLAARVLRNARAASDDEVGHLMMRVATIGGSGELDEEHLVREVSVLRARFDGLDSESQSKLALGYGYAVFLAWSFTKDGVLGVNEAGRYEEWARWSLEVVRGEYHRRRDSGDSCSEAWSAHAVNHIVYVAARTGLADDEVAELAIGVERLAVKLVNFRFLDTAAYWLMHLASVSQTDRLDEAIRFVRQAIQYLDKAGTLVRGDLDVSQHLQAAVALERSLLRKLPSERRPK